jgi:uncharacterized protein
MKYAQLSDHAYAIRLERGEDVHQTIQDLCSQLNVDNAKVEGIGSIESPTLAYYSIETKQFTDVPLDGIYEVTSLLGNVSAVEGQPFAHLHVTVSDQAMNVRGGHLVKGMCSATLELILTTYATHFAKQPDDAIGLKVWEF